MSAPSARDIYYCHCEGVRSTLKTLAYDCGNPVQYVCGRMPAVLFYLLDRHALLAMTMGAKCVFLHSLTTPRRSGDRHPPARTTHANYVCAGPGGVMITDTNPAIMICFFIFLSPFFPLRKNHRKNSGGWSLRTISSNCVAYSIYSPHSNRVGWIYLTSVSRTLLTGS